MIDVLDGDPPIEPARLNGWRRAGYPFAPYLGFASVDGDRVLGRLGVLRLKLRTHSDDFPVAGLVDVVTRPDSLGRGVATSLLRAVHRRETEDGSAAILLWTRRSWQAHRLYEYLGYRDVYSAPAAVSPGPIGVARQLPSGYELRAARRTDLPTVERLFERASLGRVGWIASHVPLQRARLHIGWRKPEDYQILRYAGRPVGYVEVRVDPIQSLVREGVLLDVSHGPALVAGIESTAKDRWVVFGRTTAVRDLRPTLEHAGYSFAESGHSVLMARRLGRAGPTPEELSAQARDERYSCHHTDTF